ncbi:MAG: sulfate ABC transporter substrate-binding protein [Blastochloris sp.]|jgi:sulfate transport system substrate-binding protein|nr:sulfate ABC transporter substrate-binding protein [Blastochloris sp.]
MKQIIKKSLSLLVLGLSLLLVPEQLKAIELLNVSYDPTREFYTEYNAAFAKHWKEKTGQDITFLQSHGGSGKQSRSVIDGIQADVVTLALAFDIDAIAERSGIINKNWQSRLPDNSSPYTSTIVLVVRKGNPKNIKDWDDLVKPNIKVITPNPKTSGGARWNYLAAWAFAAQKFSNDEVKIKDYLRTLYKNVPVLDSGARGSTTTFAQRKIGDVLLSWENEAHLIEKEFPGQTQIIAPSISILAEPPVTVVDKVVARKGTAEVAKAYLEYLYSPEAQDLIGKNFYRPRDAKAAAKYSSLFSKINLVTIDKDFGGWKKAQKAHFDDGGTFDEITKP